MFIKKNETKNFTRFVSALRTHDDQRWLEQIFNYMPQPKNLSPAMMNDFKAFMEIQWLMPLTGIAEIIGGVLIVFKKTRAWLL